ncbi:MAG: T9SS type A sorting domain-containing protein [Bacteroidota bacterium]
MKRKLLLSIMFSVLIGLSANAQWQGIGPGGGIVKCFAKGGSNIFAGTFGGGVFKTTDNGATWNSVNIGLTNTDVQALAVTITGDTVLAGTYNGGVFLSINGGTSWVSISSNLTGLGLLVQAVVIKGNKIFAGTSLGVFVLTNYSGNWTAVNTGLGTTLDVLCLLVNGGDIFVGTGAGGVFLSANDGGSWQQKNSGLGNIYVNSLAVNGTKLYAGVDGGVYSSVNNGGAWTISRSTPGFLVKSIDININGTTIYAGYGSISGTGGIDRSADNGSNWTTVTTGLPGKGVHAVFQSGAIVFAGTDGKGLYTTINDGGLWTSDDGITNTNAQSLSLASTGTNVFAGVYGLGVFKTTLNTGPWTSANSGLPATNLINTLITSGTTIFVGTEQNGVYRSTDNGASWTAMNTGLGVNLNISSFAVGGGYIYAGTQFGTGGGVYRSTVGGTTWTLVNTGLTNTDVISLAVMGTKVFAGTFYGGVFYSSNIGGSWAQVNNGIGAAYVNTLAISGTRIFAGTNNGVFTSNDDGANWYDRNNGLPQPPLPIAKSLFISGYNIFLGTDGDGVFLSNDSANNWTAVNTNLGNYNVYGLAESGTDIFAGTKGGGVFKRPMADFAFAITTNSVDVSSCGASDAVFSVAATGINITYQWQYRPDSNFPFNDVYNDGEHSGVYTNTLTVLGGQISYKNNFQYRCVIISGPTVNSNISTLTVIDTPILTVSDTTTCSPNIIDITTSSTYTATSGSITYWTNSLATDPLLAPQSISIGGTYYIKAAVGSCSDIKPVVVTINALPNLSVTDPTAVCSPGTIDITGTFTDLNLTTGTVTYWADAGATISLTTPSALDSSGTYYIQKIATGGCTDIKPVTIVIDTTPDLNVIDPPAVCFPITVDVTNTYTDLNSTTGTVTYWTDIIATIPLTNPTAVAVNGTYYIKKSVGGCFDIKSVKVIIRPLPVVTYTQTPLIVCDNDSPLTLAGGSPVGGTYTGTGVTANVFDPAVAGSGNWPIVYTYSDVYTCTDMASQTILVDLCTGIEAETASKISVVSVFPNPFSASITLTGIENSADVLMYNVIGAQVGSWRIVNSAATLQMENVPAGVYFLHIKTNSGTLIEKIIKE